MKMRIAMGLGMLAFIASAALAKSVQKDLVVDMTWTISIDANGHVTGLSTTDAQVPTINDRLAQEIRSWRFSPGKVDGKPAPTDSTLQVALALTPAEGGATYSVRVAHVATGGGYGKMTAPHYPFALAKVYRQGLVVLRVRYDGAGKVVDAALAEDAPRVDSLFVTAAIKAVRKWTFQPEIVGGHSIAADAFVPICFKMSARNPTRFDCDWRKPGSDVAETAGQAIAIDPAMTLLTDVTGRTLKLAP